MFCSVLNASQCTCSQCWCGSGASDIYQHGFTTCDYPCSGDNTEVCGGYLATSLYEMNGLPSDPPDGTKYIGCYKDAPRNRVLTGSSTTDDDMTDEVRCSGEQATILVV